MPGTLKGHPPPALQLQLALSFCSHLPSSDAGLSAAVPAWLPSASPWKSLPVWLKSTVLLVLKPSFLWMCL